MAASAQPPFQTAALGIRAVMDHPEDLAVEAQPVDLVQEAAVAATVEAVPAFLTALDVVEAVAVPMMPLVPIPAVPSIPAWAMSPSTLFSYVCYRASLLYILSFCNHSTAFIVL